MELVIKLKIKKTFEEIDKKAKEKIDKLVLNP